MKNAQRTTRGKKILDEILIGDHELSLKLSKAIAQDGPIERYNHGFHTYPAGLHPDCAKDLLKPFEAKRVLDPFCGGGTVLVEARVRGQQAVGRDIGKVALRVALLRTASPDEAVLTKVRSAARKMAEVAQSAKELPGEQILHSVQAWYDEGTLRELESLRKGLAEAPDEARPYLEALFSSILIKVSHRSSDTKGERVEKGRPHGTTAIWFHKKVREWARRAGSYRAHLPEGTPPVDLRQGDARHIECAPVDLILTSPPYPSTYDYLPLQHLRSIWLQEQEVDALEIGARRAFRDGTREATKIWKQDTNVWTRSAAGVLRSGGHLVIVIGDGLHPAGAVDTSEATEVAALGAGLRPVARASVERPDYARQSSRWEHVFVFRKP